MIGYSAAAAMTAWLNLLSVRIAIVFLAAAAGGLLLCGAGVVMYGAGRRRRRANQLAREARRGIRQLERFLADHDLSR